MADSTDFYALLGVAPDADEVAIRLAYRRLARLYHPDVAGPGSMAKMQALNVAYQTLSDPDLRRQYNAQQGWDTPPRAASHHESPTASPPPARPRASAPTASAGPLRPLAVIDAPDATPVVTIAFTQDGQRIGLGLIDGRILIWEARAAAITRTLLFGERPGAGVLQALRLSSTGALAVAWGFQLGTRVWRVDDGVSLWHTATHGPDGMMDAILLDSPPFVRLATPDAPLALADDDPFNWADRGKRGTAIYSRPLAGTVSAGWAIPWRCDETASAGVFGEPADQRWQVRHRLLSADGRLLLTYATGGETAAFTLWEPESRTRRGTPEPRRLARMVVPLGSLQFPLAATSGLEWVAAGDPVGGVRVFSPRTRASRWVPTGAPPEDGLLALGPDARFVALARGSDLELWDVQAQRRVQDWRFAAGVTALTCGMSGARLLLGVGLANGTTEVWW